MSPDADNQGCDRTMALPPEAAGASPPPSPTRLRRDRKRNPLAQYFETAVAILIAAVTVAGAFIAWRASIADSASAEAERQGIFSTISREKVQTDLRTRLYNDLRIFTDYVQNQEMARLIKQDAEEPNEASAPNKKENMEQEAETYQNLADSAFGFISFPQYVKPEANGRKSFDREGFMQASLAQESRFQDLAPENDLETADRLRILEQQLVGIVIVLSISLLFFTLAQISQSLLRYLFAIVALLAFVSVLLFCTVIELAAIL